MKLEADDRAPQATPEQKLWRAVIAQAVNDARGSDCRERDRVRSWITHEDFACVVQLTGLDIDVDRTRQRIAALLDAADLATRRVPRIRGCAPT